MTSLWGISKAAAEAKVAAAEVKVAAAEGTVAVVGSAGIFECQSTMTGHRYTLFLCFGTNNFPNRCTFLE